MVTQVLEGNMREIVGCVGLKEMVQDRQGVAKKITENVVPDMQKLGIEVVNFNIQNFKDNAGTIENMGIDNVEQIRKNAQIAKANAQRDIAIATSQAPAGGQRRQGGGREEDRRAERRTGRAAGGDAGAGRHQEGRGRRRLLHPAGEPAQDHRDHPRQRRHRPAAKRKRSWPRRRSHSRSASWTPRCARQADASEVQGARRRPRPS